MMHGDSSATLGRLNSDPNFAVDFIIDNNPEEVQAHLSGLNLLSVAPQNVTVDVLRSDVRNISDGETLQEVLTVPYVNSNSNYTGGLESELTIPPGGQQKAAGVGVAIITGITTLGAGIANFFVSQNQAEISQNDAQQALLDAQLQAELARQEAEAGKTFGIPTSAFIAVVGAIAVLFTVVLISTRKK